MSKRPKTRCAQCSTDMPKAQRVVAGKGYCPRCVNEHFDKLPCAVCGANTKTLPGAPPLCRSHQHGDKRCVKCGNPLKKGSRVLDEGRWCWPCVRKYLLEPQPCPYCGRMTKYLARDVRLGLTKPACQICRRADHVSCGRCGKNRFQAGSDLVTRQPVCRGCLPTLGEPYLCPECGQVGKQHSKTRCHDCYWRATARRRAFAQAAALPGWAAETLPRLTEALLARHPRPQHVTLRLQRYARFLSQVAAAFPDPKAVDPEVFLDQFGPDLLRRNRFAVDYLAANVFKVKLDAWEIAACIGRRQQARILANTDGAWYAPLLADYHRHLLRVAARYQRAGWTGARARFVPRTVTACLRAAGHFLAALPPEYSTPRQITQHDLDRFFTSQPGQRNSLLVFISWLNDSQVLFRRLVYSTKFALLQEPLPFAEYVSLRARLLEDSERDPKPALLVLICLTYGLSLHRVVRLPLRCLLIRDDTVHVKLGKIAIPLTSDLAPMAKHYLATRRALSPLDDDNSYLFPGRVAGSHLHPATAGEYLQRYGVSSASLVATFWSNAYRAGALDNPQVMVEVLGHHPARAIAYFQLMSALPIG